MGSMEKHAPLIKDRDQGKEVMKEDLRWEVGDGTLIEVYRDAWVDELPLERKVWMVAVASHDEELRVEHLIT